MTEVDCRRRLVELCSRRDVLPEARAAVDWCFAQLAGDSSAGDEAVVARARAEFSRRAVAGPLQLLLCSVSLAADELVPALLQRCCTASPAADWLAVVVSWLQPTQSVRALLGAHVAGQPRAAAVLDLLLRADNDDDAQVGSAVSAALFADVDATASLRLMAGSARVFRLGIGRLLDNEQEAAGHRCLDDKATKVEHRCPDDKATTMTVEQWLHWLHDNVLARLDQLDGHSMGFFRWLCRRAQLFDAAAALLRAVVAALQRAPRFLQRLVPHAASICALAGLDASLHVELLERLGRAGGPVVAARIAAALLRQQLPHADGEQRPAALEGVARLLQSFGEAAYLHQDFVGHCFAALQRGDGDDARQLLAALLWLLSAADERGRAALGSALAQQWHDVLPVYCQSSDSAGTALAGRLLLKTVDRLDTGAQCQLALLFARLLFDQLRRPDDHPQLHYSQHIFATLARSSAVLRYRSLELLLDLVVSSCADAVVRRAPALPVGYVGRPPVVLGAAVPADDEQQTDSLLDVNRKQTRCGGRAEPASTAHRRQRTDDGDGELLHANAVRLVQLFADVAQSSDEHRWLAQLLAVRLLPADSRSSNDDDELFSSGRALPAGEQQISALFAQNPILWSLLELLAARQPDAACPLFPVVHSLLAAAALAWQKPAPPPDAVDRLAKSVRLFRLLRLLDWLPAPLCHSDDLLLVAAPKDAAALCVDAWRYLRDQPPTAAARPARLAPYCLTQLRIVRANPRLLGPSVAKFRILLSITT